MAQIIYGHTLGLEPENNNIGRNSLSLPKNVFSPAKLQLLGIRMAGNSGNNRLRTMLG